MELAATIVLWIARLLTGFLVVAVALPWLRIGYWAVRVFDFPRVQLVAVGIFVLALVGGLAFRGGCRGEYWVITGVVLLVSGWQVYRVLPYTRVWTTEVPPADGAVGRLVVCNLDKDNTRHAEVRSMLERVDADVVFLIEIDHVWRENLDGLGSSYPHRLEEIREEGLGVALWSRYPLENAEVRWLVSDRRPSLWATLGVPEHEPIRFVGLHPTPPGLPVDGGGGGRYNSRIRDAELLKIAERVSDDPDHAWVIAGDLNDVAWSHTTRLFRRVSGLLDPRIGRGLMNTFHAEYPVARYPLDHIFLSEGFRVGRFERVRTPGSDHFAVLVEMDMGSRGVGADPSPDSGDLDESEELIEQGEEDAEERGE